MGGHEEAIIDLNTSLEIESNNASIIKSREIYHMIGKYEHFNKSLKIEPKKSRGNILCVG
jgi:hypothetical protein